MDNRISARQLCVAAFTGLLAPAAAAAGGDWRGALLAVPVVVLAVWAGCAAAARPGGLSARLGNGWGKVLALLYIVWGVLAAGTGLALCGQRLSSAAGNGNSAGWMLLLAFLPAFWLAASKAEAFARAGEIFYLAMGVVLAGVTLLGLRQVEVGYLFLEGAGFWSSFRTAAGIGCLSIYAVLLWNGEGTGETKRWLGWSAAGALALTLLCVLTVGSLSPALVGLSEEPFFLMTVGLGRTARAEALVAVLWLLSDVTFPALLLHAGRHLCGRVFSIQKGKRAGIVLALLALAAGYGALYLGDPVEILEEILAPGTLILGGLFPCIVWVFEKKKKTD